MFLKVKFIFSIVYLICINIYMVRLSFEKVFPKFSSSMGLLYICRIQLLLPTSKCIHMHYTISANSQIIASEILAVKIFSLTLVLHKFKFIILRILRTLKNSIKALLECAEFHGTVYLLYFVTIFFTFFLHLLNRFSAMTMTT